MAFNFTVKSLQPSHHPPEIPLGLSSHKIIGWLVQYLRLFPLHWVTKPLSLNKAGKKDLCKEGKFCLEVYSLHGLVNILVGNFSSQLFIA